MSPIQLNYSFLLFWSIFGEIHWKLQFLVTKVTTSDRSTEILRKFVYLNNLKSGKSRGKFGFVVNNPFVQSSKTEQILSKTVFLLKMSHILTNYAILLFWSFFGQNHGKVLFLFQKVTISERKSELLRNNTFLNKFENKKSQRNIWFGVNNGFCSKQ